MQKFLPGIKLSLGRKEKHVIENLVIWGMDVSITGLLML